MRSGSKGWSESVVNFAAAHDGEELILPEASGGGTGCVARGAGPDFGRVATSIVRNVSGVHKPMMKERERSYAGRTYRRPHRLTTCPPVSTEDLRVAISTP